jgi:Na+-transporting NADH:ubiquinone oxidoreductase subunit F
MMDIALGIGFLVSLLLTLTLVVMVSRAVLAPVRPATVTVNGGRKIETNTGARLLGVLNDDGILIPSACAGAGTCGLCRVTVTEGGTGALPIERARLSRSELARGMRLACQVVLRDDVGVEVPAELLAAESFECTVASTRQLTPLIREIVLQMPGNVRPEVTAGAFLQVTAPPYRLPYSELDVSSAFSAAWRPLRQLVARSDAPVTRAYSISNRPEDSAAGRMVLNIRLALPPPSMPNVPPGVVSSWLFGVQQGEAVTVSGPFGSFRAQPSEREMVLIGGGVGMAPLRAIIWDQLERLGTRRKISYWYGARSPAELFYTEEFDALAAKHENFDWTVVLSDPRPDDAWEGPTGFVHSVVWERYLRNHPAPEDCEYYLCGPPLMIRAVYSMLDDAGVERSSIFHDDFGV